MDNIVISIAGGLLPALIWLYFLLKEDSRCPEPRSIVALAFFAGVIAVPLVLFPEKFATAHIASGRTLIAMLAAIEETTKYALAALIILWRPAVDEPIDYVIYMITVAIGFAAFENALYICQPSASLICAPLTGIHALTQATLDGSRFVGSTLLHIVASASIGFALAFSFKRKAAVRIAFVTVGVIIAIALHTVFNILMISNNSAEISDALFLVWTGIVIIFALFEFVKYRTYKKLPANVC